MTPGFSTPEFPGNAFDGLHQQERKIKVGILMQIRGGKLGVGSFIPPQDPIYPPLNAYSIYPLPPLESTKKAAITPWNCSYIRQ